MKTSIALILLTLSFSSLATCPKVTGKYLCQKDFNETLLFKGKNLEFKVSNFFEYKMFNVKTDAAQVVFQQDDWMPYMDQSSDVLLFEVGTSAECNENSLNLKLHILANATESEVYVDYQITPKDDGIKVTKILNNKSVLLNNCKKI